VYDCHVPVQYAFLKVMPPQYVLCTGRTYYGELLL
jgi:hypothetical protein